MAVAMDKFNYKMPYDSYFGGVSAMSVEHFDLVNGFSNQFWGWGGEDDDMANRLRLKKLFISRYPANIARFVYNILDAARSFTFEYLADIKC